MMPSSSLIPGDDPSLLFNNAGMNQFKSVFIGTEKAKTPRAATSQKCVRAGGKHNDLDNVGFTARHHTFFEMLGNFSFGDYFKEEAIHFAWNFLTKDLGLDPQKLYVTTFTTDEEARKIWMEQIGIKKDHHFVFEEKDNFWRMGDVGPCGPCSEIFYDFGPEMGTSKEDVVGGEGDRFIEIWNLVFMEFQEDKKGQRPLPNPSIDTGMGLERISMVMQNKKSNYETDLFMPLIDKASQLTKSPYDIDDPNKTFEKAALRVLADHSRAVSFLIGDGVLPSNEGRGYVLRRILRRAVRFNHKLSANNPILTDLCAEVIAQMSDVYPELKERSSIILGNVADEEKKFLETLENGENLLEKEINKITSKGQKVLAGETAFKLYDTYGFPADLTQVILREKGLELDEKGFKESLNTAKELAKSGGKKGEITFDFPQSLKDSFSSLKPTNFLGYNSCKSEGKILEIHSKTGQHKEISRGDFCLITDQTPFYAEGGGQVGDKGTATGPQGKAQVLDVKKLDKIFVHFCKINEGSINAGEKVSLHVDEEKRQQTQRNHSATHLLHAALIQVCGTGVQQAGSSVDSERLRFDFSHKGPVSKKDLQKVEELVNAEIQKSISVTTAVMDIEVAKEAGAQALFGEKYEDKVRVLSMGNFSKELCGGTHVSNTGEISVFKITNESGVSSGVRRIEALTSFKAIEYLNSFAQKYEELTSQWSLGKQAEVSEILKQFEKLQEENTTLKKKLHDSLNQAPTPIEEVDSKYGKIKTCIFHFRNLERNELKETADKVRDRMNAPGLCVFAGAKSDKGFPILVSKTKELGELHAGNFLKSLTEKLGGKGGGRPDFAQGSLDSIESLKSISLEELNS